MVHHNLNYSNQDLVVRWWKPVQLPMAFLFVPAAGILRRAIGRRLAVGLVHLLGGGLLGRGLALGGCGDLDFLGKMVGLPMFTMINGCFTGKHGGFERKDGGFFLGKTMKLGTWWFKHQT